MRLRGVRLPLWAWQARSL